MYNRFTFRQATRADKPLIHTWWNKPHVKEFWDNSHQMWQNVENYLDNGNKDLFDYWLGLYNSEPFCLVMSSEVDKSQTDIFGENCSIDGMTCAFDFMIGEEAYLGKGMAAPTLRAFMEFCPPDVKRFLIDPASDNPRAIHVYQKAGFQEIKRFMRTPRGEKLAKEYIMMRCERGEL